ncbi:uncharacterized protein PpBr36_09903, partial [Pyricularia pennisetigena]|uniref:uncharacterized protein n=1 Tax=Pyricularia pennisetigena TaxID=1578925 RepID=UPI001154AF98
KDQKDQKKGKPWTRYSPNPPICAASKAPSTPARRRGRSSRLRASTRKSRDPPPEKANGHVLLYFTDAFGFHTKSFLMMNAFAKCGYLTPGVDYFLRSPLADPSFDFNARVNKHLGASDEVGKKWIQDVKAKYGSSESVKFVCLGRSRFVARQLNAEGIGKAGTVAHPSFLNESDVLGVNEPLFLLLPSTDELFEPKERSETIQILSEGGKQFNMQIFANVGHGFAEQSFSSFVNWFDFWLSPK